MQTLGPGADLLNQNLHFNKIFRGFRCTIKFEKHCFKQTHRTHALKKFWGYLQLPYFSEEYTRAQQWKRLVFLKGTSKCVTPMLETSGSPLPTSLAQHWLPLSTALAISPPRRNKPITLTLSSSPNSLGCFLCMSCPSHFSPASAQIMKSLIPAQTWHPPVLV